MIFLQSWGGGGGGGILASSSVPKLVGSAVVAETVEVWYG